MQVLIKYNLLEAVEYLKAGKTVVFPTETSYGLGCDATNQDAVNKIFKIKGRKSDKPLLVVVPTVEMAKKYLVWNDLLDDLSKKYWPGSLTVVGVAVRAENFQPLQLLATGVVAPDNTIAIRVTNHPVAKFLSEKLDRPVVATSANLADASDVYDSKKIEVKSDILINGGVLPHNPPTTIVSVVGNKLKILRQGELKII